MSGSTTPEIFAYGEFPTSKKLNDVLATKADVAALTDVGTSISGLQTTVAGLVSVVGAGDGGTLNALDGRVTAVETDVAGVHTSLTTLQSTVSAITGVGSIPAQVDALTTGLQAETSARQDAIAAEATVREQTDSGIVNALATKQAALGFTPLQQGTGILQSANVVKIGFDGSGSTAVRATVDQTDLGLLWSDNLAPRSIGNIGWCRIPAGFIIQWGFGVTSNGNQNPIFFPTTFPTACCALTLTSASGTNWTDGSGLIYPRSLAVYSKNPTGFVVDAIVHVPNSVPAFVAGEIFTYIAIGV